MARKRRKRAANCIYCQTAKATTVDHVPPKNLFPQPRPSTLISVPCCQSCNQSVSKDDEYFRAAIVNRRDVAITPAVQNRIDAVFRGLSRNEAEWFRKAFTDAVREVELVTPGGLYVGQGVRFDVDYDRLESVARRTVRGLYFKERGEVLPPHCRTVAYLDIGIDEGSKAGDGVAGKLITRLTSNAPRIIHADVFQYWRGVAPENRHVTLWLLLFYRSVWFLVFTSPE